MIELLRRTKKNDPFFKVFKKLKTAFEVTYII